MDAGCGQARHAGTIKDVQEVWAKHDGVWKKVCSRALNVGDLYGGGVYAGQIGYNGDTFNLVIPENALADYILTPGQMRWKSSGVGPDPGATNDYDGLANSNAINDADHPAAQFCRALTISGFSDWYLPSKEELRVVHTNKAALGISNSFAYLWSSTQHATITRDVWIAMLERASGQPSAIINHAKDSINTKTLPVRRVKVG